MNTNSVNSGVPWRPSLQTSVPKEPTHITKPQTTEASPAQSVESVGESAPEKSTVPYDLETITPQETFALARKLHEEDAIGFLDFAGLMAIGFSHQYPGPYSDQDEPNDEPFNLWAELEAIASGTHETFTHATKDDRDDVKDLLDVLKSILDGPDQTEIVSIDIQA